MSETQPFTKKLLRQLLRVSPTTFRREFEKKEPVLILNFPQYNKFNKILTDKMFYWLLEEFGLEKEESFNKIVAMYHQKDKESIERIRMLYGLNDNNLFAQRTNS